MTTTNYCYCKINLLRLWMTALWFVLTVHVLAQNPLVISVLYAILQRLCITTTTTILLLLRVVRLSVIGHSQWLSYGGREVGMLYRNTFGTCLSFRLPPRTEDRSVPIVVPWCDLTMYCALSARPSLSADLSPCTGYYKLNLLTLYGAPAAVVR